MKIYYLVLLLVWFLFLNVKTDAQKLDSEEFHIHRSDLNHSFQKFQREKSGRVVFFGGSITHNTGWRD
jgi:hypothetical protein